MNTNIYTPNLYPIKTSYKKRFLRGPLKGIEVVDTICFISKESAQRWVIGCRKNCKDWKFVEEPEHNQNK